LSGGALLDPRGEGLCFWLLCYEGFRLERKVGKRMGNLSRIGVSIDSELLRRFDRFIAERGYENRSEAFRDLIRDRLVGSAVVAPAAHVVGTLTLIYGHNTRLLPEKLTDLQHQHHEVIISTLHAHLDHDSCLEVIVLRGKSREVQELADRLISTKGVQHGRLVMSSPGILPHHHHPHHH
jgi:CopG family transcriptional regulator, nickel-responsive regulator